MDTLEEIKGKISELLESNGFMLYSFKYLKKGKNNILEIVLDRDEDIGMDDIVKASELISNKLDEFDSFSDPYMLDVSSLGAEKPLDIAKIDRYIGRYIYVHLINPIEGENSFEGDLTNTTNDSITLEFKVKTRVKKVEIKKENIDKCRFAIKF